MGPNHLPYQRGIAVLLAATVIIGCGGSDDDGDIPEVIPPYRIYYGEQPGDPDNLKMKLVLILNGYSNLVYSSNFESPQDSEVLVLKWTKDNDSLFLSNADSTLFISGAISQEDTCLEIEWKESLGAVWDCHASVDGWANRQTLLLVESFEKIW